MTTYYTNVEIATPDPRVCFVSGDPQGSLQRFINLLLAIQTGSLPTSSATVITADGAATPASATVTFSAGATGSAVVINGASFSGTQLAARVRATLTTPVAGNLIVLNGVTFTAAQLNARATATLTTVAAGNTITIGATTFTAQDAAVNLGDATFCDATSDTATATSLAAQINGHAVASTVVTASSAAGVVKIRALTAGTAGNAIILSRVGAPIALTATGGGALAGAFLEGGLAQSVAGWDYGDSNTQGAVALAAVLNASTNSAISTYFTATSASNVVTIKAKTEGTAANSLAITKTGGPIVLTAQGGGADTGVLQNGAAYSGNQFDSIASGGSDTIVAASLAAAINRSATAKVTGVVTATSAAAVTTISAVTVGLGGNDVTLTASGTGPTAGAAALAGGTSTLISTSW